MAPFAMKHGTDENNNLRQEMVDRLKNLGLVRSAPVEEALRAVPRHLFISHVDARTAYSDQAVVTRWQDGEAISSASAPSIVTVMLELLDLRPGQRVLEIGAGTGYNAALMARIVGSSGQIVTIDIDDEIVQGARANLRAVGSEENIQVICGDGALGWSESAPYDRVILTVSSADLLPAWHEQLARGGRLVGPLRLLGFHSQLTEPPLLPDQFLLAFEWTGSHFESLALMPCVFVPLRGDFASMVRKVSREEDLEGLSASLPAGIKARSTFALLRGPAQDEVTDVHLAFREMFGLRLWLALREEHFCEIYVPESAAIGSIPAQLRRDKAFAAAIGLCGADNCCLLKLEEEAEDQPVDPKRPFRLVIQCYGKDRILAERLRAQLESWDRAGHPFVWSMDGFGARMRGMRVQAFPQEMGELPVVQEHETLLTRPHTRFLFTAQAGAEKSSPMQAERESGVIPTHEHRELLKLGKERWNQWRKEHPEIQPKLVACDLSGLLLKELDLRGVHLNGSNLERADLFGSDLSGADLRGVNLSQVRAANVNLSGANLSGADLRGIFIFKASLNGANLSGANLEEARIKKSSLMHANLAGANLNFAHLNHVDLVEAGLVGTSRMGLDLQETRLPDLDAAGDTWFRFRQRMDGWSGTIFTEEARMRESQDFAVGQHPLVVIEETAINTHIHIQGWDEPTIRVMSEGQLPELRQDKDAVFLRGVEDDLLIYIPHIPHGILRLVEHGGSSITTAITATDLRGNITIEESGRVELRDVDGRVILIGIAGDIVLTAVRSEVDFRHIAGSVLARDVRYITGDSIGGSLIVEGIKNALNCGLIGGNCFISGCQEQTMIGIGRIGGNARLEGRTYALDCRVGGNVELHCAYWPRPKGMGRVVAGGNLSLYLPTNIDLALGITSGSSISGDARVLSMPPSGNFANLLYGTGQARLDITASGGVRVLSEEAGA